jgi:ABC-type multidrug transport system ATPase subunit
LGTGRPRSDRPAQPLVCIEQVRYSYPDGTQALEDVSLTVRAGEVHALIGGSGAGKTTLLKHVVGLLKPAAGQLTVCGEEVRKKRVAEWAGRSEP